MNKCKQNLKESAWAFKLLGVFSLFLVAILFFSSDWFLYNIVYKPWYHSFGEYFYNSYFFTVLTACFILIIIILLFFFLIFYIRDKMQSIKNKIIITFIILLFLGFLILGFVKPTILDLILVVKGQYFTTESDLSRYREEVESSGRGSSMYYRIYTYELEDNERKKESRRGKSDLYLYKDFDLDVYQKKDIEKLYLENGSKKIKVYYLPNTKTVLRYELLN